MTKGHSCRLQAQRARRFLANEMSEALAGLDAVVGLSRGVFSESAAGNALGFPETTFPIDFNDVAYAKGPWEDPVTQSAWGPLYSDSILLAIVEAFQEVNQEYMRMPPLDATLALVCAGSQEAMCAHPQNAG